MSSRAYRENYRLIQWTHKTTEVPRAPESKYGVAAYYVPDITPFQSPLSGKIISSRTQLRHEERGYGVKQCGELNKVSDFDNSRLKPQAPRDKAVEAAFGKALEKLGMR